MLSVRPVEFAPVSLIWGACGRANAELLHHLGREGRENAMAYSYAHGWGTSTSTYSRRAAMARLDKLAILLDTALTIPGTNIRFGLDGMIGLVPGIGDAITTALSAYIVYEAHMLGAPRHLLMRMIANVVVDGAIGAVPLAGDALDLLWRANRRNMRLLREWADREGVV